MKVGAAIYSMLKDDSAVAALVGTRIYPELAEEGAATPYVVYSVVSNTPVDTKDSAPVDEAQLEVFSVADTYAAANDLADKVRDALARKSKLVYDLATVQSIKYTNEVTEVSAERNMYISVQDYTVRLTPMVPFVGLLDTYGGAKGAWSLRKLLKNYTGSCVRVRRDDDAEQDIGFNYNGDLDTDALTAFCGSSNGFVKRWYDQAGGDYAAQSDPAKQPKIYDATTGVILQDGEAALHFDGVDDFLQRTMTGSDIYSANAEATIASVMTQDTESDSNVLVSNQSTAPDLFTAFTTFNGTFVFDVGNSGNNRVNGAAGAGWYDTQHVVFLSSSFALQQIAVNGVVINTSTASDTITHTSSTLRIGGRFATYFGGTIQELVMYNTDESSNRTGIESNMNTYYNIY